MRILFENHLYNPIEPVGLHINTFSFDFLVLFNLSSEKNNTRHRFTNRVGYHFIMLCRHDNAHRSVIRAVAVAHKVASIEYESSEHGIITHFLYCWNHIIDYNQHLHLYRLVWAFSWLKLFFILTAFLFFFAFNIWIIVKVFDLFFWGAKICLSFTFFPFDICIDRNDIFLEFCDFRI